VWAVHNKYKAELVVSYSVVDEGNDNGLHGDETEISPAPRGASQRLWREHGKWSSE